MYYRIMPLEISGKIHRIDLFESFAFLDTNLFSQG